jgi:hypothetical protein
MRKLQERSPGLLPAVPLRRYGRRNKGHPLPSLYPRSHNSKFLLLNSASTAHCPLHQRLASVAAAQSFPRCLASLLSTHPGKTRGRGRRAQGPSPGNRKATPVARRGVTGATRAAGQRDRRRRVWAREAGAGGAVSSSGSLDAPGPAFPLRPGPSGAQDSTASGSGAPGPGAHTRKAGRLGDRRSDPARGVLPARARAVAGWAHAHPRAPP